MSCTNVFLSCTLLYNLVQNVRSKNCSSCSFSSYASTKNHSYVFAELNSRLEDVNRTIYSGVHHTCTTPHTQLQIKMFFFFLLEWYSVISAAWKKKQVSAYLGLTVFLTYLPFKCRPQIMIAHCRQRLKSRIICSLWKRHHWELQVGLGACRPL